MKLDKEDKFYEIKLQTFKADRLSSLKPAEKVNQNNKKKTKKEKHQLIMPKERMKHLQIKG